MAGQRSPCRNFRCFLVPDLSQHDDVGILSQNGTQGGGKGQSYRVPDAHLRDPGHPVFDRVLHRYQVVGLRLHLLHDCIEGRGLAASRRTGNQEHPLGLAHYLDKAVEHLLAHAQVAERGHPVASQNPYYDLFSIYGRECRYPQVDGLLVKLQGTSAVLGEPAICYVESGENFDPRDDRILDRLRDLEDTVQVPVHTKPYLYVAFLRFDMNIACA